MQFLRANLNYLLQVSYATIDLWFTLALHYTAYCFVLVTISSVIDMAFTIYLKTSVGLFNKLKYRGVQINHVTRSLLMQNCNHLTDTLYRTTDQMMGWTAGIKGGSTLEPPTHIFLQNFTD